MSLACMNHMFTEVNVTNTTCKYCIFSVENYEDHIIEVP